MSREKCRFDPRTCDYRRVWRITEQAHEWRDRHPRIGWIVHVWPYVLFGLGFLILGSIDWTDGGGSKVEIAVGVGWLFIAVVEARRRRRAP